VQSLKLHEKTLNYTKPLKKEVKKREEEIKEKEITNQTRGCRARERGR